MVVSGPSGVGKTSVVEGLAARRPFHFSVSLTTRPPRPGEVEGEDYFFVDRDEFMRRVAAGELLEWAEYGGNLYGTPKGPVLKHLERGDDVLLDIENEGAKQIKAAFPQAILIFLLPPSMEVLEERLRRRGDTSAADTARRLAVARAQIEEAPRIYDHLVVNDDLETAIAEIVSILDAQKRRSAAPVSAPAPGAASSPPDHTETTHEEP